MSITSVQYGAVQTAYVGSATYSLGTANQNLITYWPQPYVTATNILAATTNIICVATGTSLTFPDANQVSTGYNVFIKSSATSDQNFNVLDNTGGLIQAIAPGEIWWIQLDAYTTDTTAGVWSSIQMGVGTTTINVNAIKGYGLEVLPNPGTELSTYTPVNTITTTTYNVQDADQSSMLLLNGVSTVVLPDLSITQQGGFYVSFNNTNSIAVTFTSSGTINGLASPPDGPGLVIYPNQTGTLVQDSSGNWWTLGLGQGFTFAQTVITIPLSGATVDLTATQLSNFVLQFTGNLTENLIVYFGTTPSNWYIQNACTTNAGVTLEICAGSAATSSGTNILLESNQNYIVYLAPVPNVGTFQLYETPTLTAPEVFNAIDGGAADPSFAFINDPHSGMFLQSASNPSITANSTAIARFDGATNTAVQILANPNAMSANKPTFSFIGQTTTGMGSSASPTLDLYANNVKVLMASATTVTCPVALTVSGLSTLTGGFTSASNSNITGSSTFTVGTGLTTLGGGLSVTGTTTLTGTNQFAGITSVTGANTFSVGTGLTTLGGDLTVTGTTVLNTPLGIAYGGTGATNQQNAALAILPQSPDEGASVYYQSSTSSWISGPNYSGTSSFGLPYYNATTSSMNYTNLDSLPNNLPAVVFLSKVTLPYGQITTPTTDGTYTLKCIISGGGASASFQWV